MGAAVALKVAVTVVAAFKEMVQVAPVPLQPPDHSANLEPELAAAVSLTDVPGANFAAHVLPQLTPEGLLVTVPAPVPALFTVSWTGAVEVKVAVTVVAAFKEMVQVALVPLHPPDHPANLDPDLAAAVSLTDVPGVNFAAHVLPQLTPEGLLVTVPAPVPALFTVSWTGAVELKVAVTVVAAFKEMVQVALVPLHPPDHPANLEPDLAAAVSLTDVPGVNFAAHVLPQLTPEGLLVTVPAPVPALFTVSWTGAVELKVAVTVVAAFKEMVQVALVPLHPPDHPANLEPDLAAAVSLTDVPGVNFAAHVLPQLTPEGLLVTVPAPVPALFTVSWTGAVELKVAVTVVAAFKEMVQVALVPLHPPDHSANLEPDLAAAVSLTDVPGVNFAAHVLPQLTPEELLVPVPPPVPALFTVSWTGAVELKVAVTVAAALRETVQVALVPLHPPDH